MSYVNFIFSSTPLFPLCMSILLSPRYMSTKMPDLGDHLADARVLGAAHYR